jgi:hypothetical protein
MKTAPHLLVYISGHGYGHVAQVAPILNALSGLIPDLRLTLRSVVPIAYLKSRIAQKFQYISHATDFGMVMVSAFEVDVAASMSAYINFHADWEDKIKAESTVIASLSPSFVLSDVAYLPLASAVSLGIPSIAMCSLNWADVFRHYCADMDGATEILQQMELAYSGADAFLRLLPAMPMSWLDNTRDISMVAHVGTNRRDEIIRKIHGADETKLILVSMGGIATHLSLKNWPRITGVRWLVQSDWLVQIERDDILAFDALDMNFSDILASTDVLLTKPGYGAFTEAVGNGIPVLYVRRDDWPEQAYLVAWLEQHGVCRRLDVAQVQTGDFQQELQSLLTQGKHCPIKPTGVQEAANFIAQRLAGPAV